MRSIMRSTVSMFAAGFMLSAGLLACRPDTTTDDVVTPVDTGTDVTRLPDVHDAGNVVDTGTGMDVQQPDVQVTDTGTTIDAGPCSTPGTLHPPHPDAGTLNLYCPFGGVDGGSLYCHSGAEHCCEPTMGMSVCDPLATACPAGNTDWQCEDPGADCPAGSMCCGTGTLMINPNPACANFASGFHGTHCATSCTASEIRMCTSDGECGTGQHCIPFKTKGNQVGGCM